MNSTQEDLPQTLSLLDATMINVGSMIGSGIFIVPATVALYVDSSFPFIAVWIFGGLISLCGALSIAELGAMMPKDGGQYVYLREVYHPFFGYLYGWTNFAVIMTGSIAAVAVGFATYLGYFIPMEVWEIRTTAIVSILFLTAAHTLSTRFAAMFQNVFTFAKIFCLLVMIVLPFIVRGSAFSNFVPVFSDRSLWELSGPLGLALIAVLWAFDGWIEITYVAGEVRDPQRNIPLSLITSTLIVIVLYVSVNIACIYILSLTTMAHSHLVASDAATVILGGVGASVVALAVMISMFGANNGFVFTGARIYYAMAKEGLFFRSIGNVHPQFQTPHVSLIAQGVWACALVLTGTFEQLFTYVVFASWLFYAMSCGAVLLLRIRSAERPRPYRTWGYPFAPIVFILFSLFLVVNTIIEDPRDALTGLGIIALGTPMYFYWKRASAISGEEPGDLKL